ncbi:type II toxin-antitoxin system RelE family toxin [Halochromatium roseum]|uniref:type II toxin-antitoxin system RelE family toxin n=1 Tax=Halochromatium roseum TaxID=391920 RepID=UPI00191134EA|nr:type II toxin-antitoxin system RelE/ParE family toxin [Halochromatium roseum]MBK5940977.1 addiction module toxin RelE [Halochromatium roseum]
MSYELAFHPLALKEWRRLDATVRSQFKKKLTERLENPQVPAAQLSGRSNRYKLKLRAIGYRLVYEVQETELLVLVVAVGKHDNTEIDRLARNR